MSNSPENLALYPVGKGGRNVTLPVDGGSHLYAGTMLAQLTATKMLVPATTANSGRVVAVATHEQDATGLADAAKREDCLTDQIFSFANSGSDPVAEGTADLGQAVYAEDDHTIALTDASSTLPLAGYYAGMEEDGKVRVFIPLRA